MVPRPSGPDRAAEPGTGLYLHIPFCAVKCRFCDFAAYPGRRAEIPRYLRALTGEVERRAQEFPGRRLDTLFIGGGTPSLLEPGDWRTLMRSVQTHFRPSSDWEASVECNPDGVTEEKLSVWREEGINRLSFGLQSDDPALLEGLGRTHSWEDFVYVFQAARRRGFDNLNVDLMYGLPGQTLSGWARTVDRVMALGPDHVSAYGLQVEESTYFHRSGVRIDDDLQADMYERAADLMEAHGFLHYEISNFARLGFECRHNLRYWRNQECLGVGVSAAWYDGKTRWTNTEDLTDYLEGAVRGRVPLSDVTALDPEARMGEDLMLGLRLREGLELTARAKELFGSVFDRFVGTGHLVREGNRYRPTRLGWRLSNQIFVHLLEAN